MSDLVKRLRKENSMLPYYGPPKLQIDAADRIEQLEANKSEQVLALKYHIDQQYAEIVRFQSRIKKLEAALRELGDYNRFGWTMQTEIARAALEEK